MSSIVWPKMPRSRAELQLLIVWDDAASFSPRTPSVARADAAIS
jgi:hypothetical protein